MVFSMCIDTTTFNLKVAEAKQFDSSEQHPLVSVEYLQPQDEYSFDGDPNALVHLNNFSGTLLIVRNENNTNLKQKMEAPPSHYDPLGTSIKREKNFDSSITLDSANKQEVTEEHHDHESTETETLELENAVKIDLSETSTMDNDKSLERISEECEERKSLTSEKSDYSIPTHFLKQHAFNGSNRLHLQCKSDVINVRVLEALLKSQPSLASQRDSDGKLPLHILTRNESLICGRQKLKVRSFVMSLLKMYPASAYAIDNEGHIPFTEAIYDWIDNSNRSIKSLAPSQEFLKSFTNVWGPNNNVKLPSTLVQLTEIVKWSFEMLSMILEQLEKSDYLKSNDIVSQKNNENNQSIQSTVTTTAVDFIIAKFASIPSLLKTLLLIHENYIKFQILELSIFQKTLLNKHTVGTWLVSMLGSNNGLNASRAVDYFDVISSITIESALALQTRARVDDRRIFYEMQEDLVQHLADFEGIIPSLFLLNEEEKTRASSKVFVQRILHLRVSNPIMIGWLMLDLSFNTLMLVAYPFHISVAVGKFDNGLNHLFTKEPVLLLWICGYFFLRDNLANIVMAKSYKFLFKRYFLFTELIKNLAILFTFISTIMPVGEDYREIYPLTIGLLWLRLFISYIELNVNLASIMLSVGRIIKGILSFLIFLLCFTAMFSEIMKINYVVNMSTLCADVNFKEDKDFAADFCSDNFFRAFFRVYALLAGDMTVDPYRTTTLHSFVYTLFNMFGNLVLLNILIAVVIDIYQNSFAQRQTLLAKERLFLLAKHVSLQTFFDNIRSEEYKYHKYADFLVKFAMTIVVILFQISIIFFIENVFRLKHYLYLPFLTILILVAYMIITNLALLFLLGKVYNWDMINNLFDTTRDANFIWRAIRRGSVKVMHTLLGFRKDFWSETEENDSLVRTFRSMLKETETRIISKLMVDLIDIESDKPTDSCSDGSKKLTSCESDDEGGLFI